MFSIINTGLSGIRTHIQRLRATAHNAANITTTGFKATKVRISEGRNNGVLASGLSRPTTPGFLIQTNNSLDLAIQGAGFFQFDLPDGTVTYSRSGAFQISESGKIVSPGGIPLKPSINIPKRNGTVTIAPDGTVSFQTGAVNSQEVVGQIAIARFRNLEGLSSVGNNQFISTEVSGQPIIGTPGTDGFGTIAQGYLESSNVDILDTNVDFIANKHAFQANIKSIQTGDDIAGSVINLKK